MTKRELHSLHGSEVIEISASTAFAAIIETARQECPFLSTKPIDQVCILRNEGMLQGWYACLDYLRTVGKPVPPSPEPRMAGPLYADPTKNSDLNK